MRGSILVVTMSHIPRGSSPHPWAHKVDNFHPPRLTENKLLRFTRG